MCDVESEPEPAPAAAAADCEEAPGDVGTTRLPDLSPDGWPIYPSVTERYFTTYVTSNHQALHVHSNGICLLGLAPSHPLLAPGAARITGVAFRDHDAKNLLANEVRGKRKSGNPTALRFASAAGGGGAAAAAGGGRGSGTAATNAAAPAAAADGVNFVDVP